MSELALRPIEAGFDLRLDGRVLDLDDGLETAIAISLFSDATARVDDVLPQIGADRRGWWGDLANADADDRLGSRLWLLAREKLLPGTALRARDMAREALNWLMVDGVVRELNVDTELTPPTARYPTGALAIGVSVVRPEGPARQRYDFVWTATAESLAA